MCRGKNSLVPSKELESMECATVVDIWLITERNNQCRQCLMMGLGFVSAHAYCRTTKTSPQTPTYIQNCHAAYHRMMKITLLGINTELYCHSIFAGNKTETLKAWRPTLTQEAMSASFHLKFYATEDDAQIRQLPWAIPVNKHPIEERFNYVRGCFNKMRVTLGGVLGGVFNWSLGDWWQSEPCPGGLIIRPISRWDQADKYCLGDFKHVLNYIWGVLVSVLGVFCKN